MTDLNPANPLQQFIYREFFVVKESFGWSYTHPDWDGDTEDGKHGFSFTPTGCQDAVDEYWRERNE